MNQLPGSSRDNGQQEVREAMEQAHQISNYLRCGLDKNTLAIMISMVENGVKPEHVAAIVREIKSMPGN
jgi:mitotic-spindle organizing protein 1